MSRLALIALSGILLANVPRNEIGSDEILKRSVAANEADWRAEPSYDHCERDDDGDSAKTYDVTMIAGTPYERLVAIDDQPLGAQQQREQQQTRARALVTRRTQSAADRAKRLGAYDRKHARVRDLFHQLAEAFVFTSRGTERIGGRAAYHLAATPRPDYRPPTRDARALTGMDADFWIDVETYHWVKIVAHVTRPVSIVGLFLRVEPGTVIEVEKAPVEGNVWLMTHLLVRSSSRILLLVPHHTYEDDRYFEYRRSSPYAHTVSGCLASR